MRLSLSQLMTAFAMLGLACQSNNASGPVLPAPNLPAPAFLTSISLDSAIHLDWDDTPFQSDPAGFSWRSEEHTSELQSQSNLVCRLLLEKKKTQSHALTSTKRHADTGNNGITVLSISEPHTG